MTHYNIASVIFDSLKLDNFRIEVKAPGFHALKDLLVRLEHSYELSRFVDLDGCICSAREPNLSKCLEIIHDLVCEAYEAAVLRNKIDNLLAMDIEDNKHGLVGLNNIDLVLTFQVIGKADMIFFALAHKCESRVRCLVKSYVIELVGSLVVSGHDVSSNDSISNLSDIVASSRLVGLLNDPYLV